MRLQPPALALLAACMLAALPVAGAQPAKPIITRIDPPNWFADLPSPMLLLAGTGLVGARFAVSGRSVHISNTSISPNGHWAILTLDTHSARPETLHLTATTPGGTATVDYTLKARRSAAEVASGFSPKDVMYLIMPDRFADGDSRNNLPATYNRAAPQAYHGGDLRGIIDHLDYLQQLGVTTLWLTPIVANDPAGRDYHGYHAFDLYAVDPRFGTLAEYRELADALHRRQMKLVFDAVPNHMGPASPWVADPPQPDWFHGTTAQHLDNQYHFQPSTDPHAPDQASHDALDGWFVNRLPDMNQQNPAVAQYETENMIWWIEEAGVDGLRIDTFPYVQREFWQSYLGTLKSLYPNLTAVGEVSDGDPTINAFYAGGRTLNGVDTHLDTPFDYPMYYAVVNALLNGKPMSSLQGTLRQDWLYPHPESLVPFLGNHDQIRFMSLPGATPALLRLGFGLVMTLRGTPELYAGDEIAMAGGEDPDNRRDFPGGFPGDAVNAFTAAGRTPAQNAMHDWVAALGSLRARTPALQTGLQQTVLATDSTFAYVRLSPGASSACGHAQPSVLIALNRSGSPQTLTVPAERTALAGCTSLDAVLGDAPQHGTVVMQSSGIKLELPAFGFAVYSLR